MFSAASRFLIASACFWSAAGLLHAATPARTSPPRPTATATSLPTKKFGRIDYVAAEEVGKRLSLKLTWVQRGRKLTLSGPDVRADLENDTRSIVVNGIRLFLGEPILDSGGRLYVSRIDFERALTPLLRPGFGTTSLPSPAVVVLDPGHGGKDTGTSAYEKTYALDVARRAKRILESAGHRVVLTREKDVFLDLTERAAIANANRAGLFASIHFNAIPKDNKTSGVEVFTFAPQFQRSTNAWGGRNDDTEKTAAPVNRHDHWSSVLAHSIHRRFVSDLKTFDRGKKLAHWGVLRGLNCPGVLIECGFLTSTTEARKISTPEYRQRLAEAIASGIRDYARKLEAQRLKSSARARTTSDRANLE